MSDSLRLSANCCRHPKRWVKITATAHSHSQTHDRSNGFSSVMSIFGRRMWFSTTRKKKEEKTQSAINRKTASFLNDERTESNERLSVPKKNRSENNKFATAQNGDITTIRFLFHFYGIVCRRHVRNFIFNAELWRKKTTDEANDINSGWTWSSSWIVFRLHQFSLNFFRWSFHSSFSS